MTASWLPESWVMAAPSMYRSPVMREIPDRSMLSTVSASTAMLPWKVEQLERAVASAWLLIVAVAETEQGDELSLLPNCAMEYDQL
jgi:hypothetical protein